MRAITFSRGVAASSGRHAALALAFVTTLGSGAALAGEAVNTGYFGGVAIMGYDPVAYFTEGQPMKGSEQLAYEWLGTPWHFANDKHRQLFISSPARYAPQYGGHCVIGTAFGEATMNIDPEAWRIIDGKLYLNYSRASIAELDKAVGAELLAKADANWGGIEAKLKSGKSP